MIRIDKGASGTDSFVHDRVLHLDGKPRSNSIPSLVIDNDDVKASHGASIGQVDREQVFYLKTRGLNEKEAERILVDGFCEDIFSRVPVASVREQMRQQLFQKQGRTL